MHKLNYGKFNIILISILCRSQISCLNFNISKYGPLFYILLRTLFQIQIFFQVILKIQLTFQTCQASVCAFPAQWFMVKTVTNKGYRAPIISDKHLNRIIMSHLHKEFIKSLRKSDILAVARGQTTNKCIMSDNFWLGDISHIL